MLCFETAKKIGLNACIDKIGREFVRKYADSTATAYGEVDGCAFCFVGVDNRPQSAFDGETLTLDSQSQFPYRASCNVSMTDGSTRFFDCVVPN